MQDRQLATPKSPADIDRIIECFRQFYGRNPNPEEFSAPEYIRQLLIEKESASKEAAAD